MSEPLVAYSLSNFREIILGCLERSGARSIVEIGSEYGSFTQELADHARRVGGRLTSIDPAPQPAAVEFFQRNEGAGYFTFLRKTSLEAIGGLGEVDVYVVDGDHNYFTVRSELEAIAAHQARHARPLLVFEHDVGWPCARRDMYYAPERIPERSRQPYSHSGGVRFGRSDLVAGGFGDVPSVAFALEEGGKKNGVRTAIEDFLAEHPELRFEFVPGFFGLGVVYSRDAPWADRVAEFLRPFADNVLLDRIEQNRDRLLSRVLELEHHGADTGGTAGGYLSGEHLLEVFMADGRTKFEALYRARLESRLRDEDDLAAQGVHQFALPGVCVVCNRITRFTTDRMFAETAPSGRVTPAWRERQVCSCGLNCRQRSSYHVLTHLPGLTRQSQVFCAEQSPLSRFVLNAFPRAVDVASMRAPSTSAPASNAPGARFGFGDATLDCIFGLNLLEHVPDVRATVCEMARCLRPGGWLLLTPNLHFDRDRTVTRATQDENGAVTHRLAPVHHPDPGNPRGLLAFHDIGWDVLSTLRECGFASAEIVVYTAPHYGYVGLQYVVLASRGAGKISHASAGQAAGGKGRADVAR